MVTNSHSSSIPDGWRLARLGDICNAPEYGAPASAIPFDATLPRYVRISDVTDDGRLKEDDRRSAEPHEVDGYELYAGDLLFARSGSVGRTYLYRTEAGPCVFAGYLIRFRPLPEQATAEYLSHFTHSQLYTRWITATARRGAQHNINAAEYRSLPILLPPLHEQRRIAEVLDSIDEAIERAESVITSTEQLRDALLQELLTKGVPGWHTEWKDAPNIGQIPACWEVARLGDVAEVKGGKRLPKGAAFANEHTDHPYIRVVDFGQTTVDLRNIQFLTDDIHRSISSYTISSADVYISIAGTIGLVGIVPRELDGANLTENAAKIVISKPHRLHQLFAMNFLNSANGKGQIRERVHLLAQPKLALERIRTVQLPLPPLPEQQAIAEALDGVESAIDLARTHVQSLKLAKDSSADALLTGRVRVAGK